VQGTQLSCRLTKTRARDAQCPALTPVPRLEQATGILFLLLYNSLQQPDQLCQNRTPVTPAPVIGSSGARIISEAGDLMLCI
jgi:hypothetical protein